MSRGRVLGAVAGVIVVLVGVVLWWAWPRAATELTEDDALAAYEAKASESGGGSNSDDSTSNTGDDPSGEATDELSIPQAGVYTYRATGEQVVQLSPLPASVRPMPAELNAFIVRTGDGCYETTINFFAEHIEETSYCLEVGDDGEATVAIGYVRKHQDFGPFTTTSNLDCDPNAIIVPNTPEFAQVCTMVVSGSPVAVEATLTGTVTLGEYEERTVGDETVEARPLTMTYTNSGSLGGGSTETLWFTREMLPVLIERDISSTGAANFTDRSTLELVSVTPKA